MKQIIHGGDVYGWSVRHPGERCVDFSANCNPYGMPPRVRDAYLSAADRCEQYPDPLCRELKEVLAAFESVPPEWIVCGNGASDLIYRVARAVQPRRALLPAPTFAEYGLALQAVGCVVNYHFLGEASGFHMDEGILSAIPGNDILFLCNPNNPTGVITDGGLLEEIIWRCGREGTTLVIDECFREFLPDPGVATAKRALRDNGNLVILNAFTKYYAMPGIRLGHAIASDSGMRDRLEACGAEWSVSVPAQVCGVAAAGEREYLRGTTARLLGEGARMAGALREMGMKLYDSQANYLFFRSPVTGLHLRLSERGILIRDCANYPGLGPGYYRTAVRRREENALLLAAVRDTMGEGKR